MKKLSLLLGCTLLCSSFCLAQPFAPGDEAIPDAPMPQTGATSSSQPAATGQSTPSPAAQTSPQTPANNGDQVKLEEKQRLLGIVPAFNTVQGGAAAPLTPGQKFDLWFHTAIDPFTFAVAGIDAGIEQAENSYPEYHQGFEGFAKRYGAAYADSVDGNLWGNAILPVILHQDPRYFRLGQGTKKHRLGYALLSTVRCKSDKGNWQPSYSNIGGNLIGGAISNLYYPASDRGVGLTIERGLTVTAEGAIGSVAFEFYPDLLNWYKNRHRPAAQTAP